MSLLTIVYAIAMYASLSVMFFGLVFKICQYIRTPAPLKIPTTPAPVNRRGVGWRMFKEVFLFTSLFKASKWTWAFGWIFHVTFVLVLLGHLRRLIPLPNWFVWWSWSVGLYVAVAMLFGLGGLWIRRIAVDRVRYISAPSDHLMLALISAIAVTGILMRSVARTDVVALKAFFVGLISLQWHNLPAQPVVLIHVGLVMVLMLVFPFSKLLHAPGVFFSPTRYQVDNPRERRHVTHWSDKPESDKSSPESRT